jgi:hypothetical protein
MNQIRLLDNTLYIEVWDEREHVCECCNERLGLEGRTYMFHHILEKRKKKIVSADYSRFRHCKWNILILCRQCHDAYERNPLTKPSIHLYRSELVVWVNIPDFCYDRDHFWINGVDDQPDYDHIQSLFPKQQLKFAS